MVDKKRRQMVSAMGAGVVAVPVAALVTTLPSHAASMVDPASAQASALQYVEKSEKPDQMCTNCGLFQGAADAASGPCPLFPGSEVAGEAWCSAYNPKA